MKLRHEAVHQQHTLEQLIYQLLMLHMSCISRQKYIINHPLASQLHECTGRKLNAVSDLALYRDAFPSADTSIFPCASINLLPATSATSADGGIVGPGPSTTSTATTSAATATATAVATTTSSTAAVACHFSETRINLLLGLGQKPNKVTRLLGVCNVLAIGLCKGLMIVAYCQW